MKRALLFTFIVLSLAACKDKDKPEPDKTAMISKKWKQLDTNPVAYWTFNADGSGLHQPGSGSYPLSWNFINDQKSINVIVTYNQGNIYNKNWDIVELTESRVKFLYNGSDFTLEKAQ